MRAFFLRAAQGAAAARRALPLGATAARRTAALGLGVGGAVALCAPAPPESVNFKAVYRDIAALLENENYDDGSYGPVFIRLAWHAAGTYDKKSGTGGSNGATMRHAPESGHGANAGLDVARKVLERVKAKHPGLSYADLWSLAGVVAIQEMAGPDIPWSSGRSDSPPEACTPDGRLPDATQGPPHLRDVFGRMGFTDRDIVALSGAHAVGRCHKDRSGFVGPWTHAPTTMSNEYFRLLLEELWVPKTPYPGGPKQFEDARTRSLMMLPSDLALVQDAAFKPLVVEYAHDRDAFFKDFAAAFAKLQGLGCKGLAKPAVFARAQ